jgi:hypothetical protein
MLTNFIFEVFKQGFTFSTPLSALHSIMHINNIGLKRNIHHLQILDGATIHKICNFN